MTVFPFWRKDEQQKKKFVLPPTLLPENDKMRKDYYKSYLKGHHAFLRIDQGYRSNNFNGFSQKILYLEKEQGGWRIIGEISL